MVNSCLNTYQHLPFIVDFNKKECKYLVSKTKLFFGYIGYIIIELTFVFLLYTFFQSIVFIVFTYIIKLYIFIILSLIWLMLNYLPVTKDKIVKFNVLKIGWLYFLVNKKKVKVIKNINKKYYKLIYNGDYVDYELYDDYKDIKMLISNKQYNTPKIIKKYKRYKGLQYYLQKWKYISKQEDLENKWYCMFIFNKIPKNGKMIIRYI